MRATEGLTAAKLGEEVDIAGKRVVVIGGGNVAMDAARTALRLRAASVEAVSLESLQEMPAHPQEIEEAQGEGVVFRNSCGVRNFRGTDRLEGVELMRCVSVVDENGRFNPVYDESSIGSIDCDVVIVAAGMRPDAGMFGLPTNSSGTIQADPGTLQTSVPHVFAAGDAVTGPTMITTAVGQGRRAAFMVDRWIQGRPLDPDAFEGPLPMVDKNSVLARQKTYQEIACCSVESRERPGPGEFYPEEETLEEWQALRRASRCLDCGGCSECRQCVAIWTASTWRCEARRWKLVWERSSWQQGSTSSRPTSSLSTATTGTRTSSQACRWTGFSPQPVRTTRWSAPATGRCPTT
jgi:heterodisulfide reductase subunit A